MRGRAGASKGGACAAAHTRRPDRGAAKAAASVKGKANGPRAFSPRAALVHEALARAVERIFSNAEPSVDYGMRGWRIPRRTRVEGWDGAMDPNYVQVYLVERKGGMTLHVWNPVDPHALKRNEQGLAEAGFNVMVGCVQYNRKGEVPVHAVVPLLEAAKRAIDGEAP